MMFPSTPHLARAILGGTTSLELAVRSVAAHAKPRLTSQGRPVDAILEVARACDADIIAVDARHESSIYRWLTGSTTAAVGRRARRSVLLAPLAHEAEPTDEMS